MRTHKKEQTDNNVPVFTLDTTVRMLLNAGSAVNLVLAPIASMSKDIP